MTRPRRLQVHLAIENAGFLPLFTHGDPDVATAITAACAAGGASVVEFTNRGDRALSVFRVLSDRRPEIGPDLILGAGSVVDVTTAALFIAAGADFLVSPYFVPGIARLCHGHRIGYLPGAGTSTEIARAEASGVELVKLFPAATLGPDFIRHHLGPCPQSRLVPTGGIDATEAAVSAWISAGAAAVGLGSQLIPSRTITLADIDRLPDRVRAVGRWVEVARGAG